MQELAGAGKAERRTFKRVAVDLLCSVTMPNGVRHAATARNISTGGIFVECDRQLSKEERYVVAINLQLRGRLHKVEAEVEVIHGPARISMTAFGAGMRFLGLDGQALEIVEEFVAARPALG